MLRRRQRTVIPISDALWAQVEPLLPPPRRDKRPYQRQPGGGRKRQPARKTFEAIVYVLREGCAWQRLPAHMGSASTVHRYFNKWLQAGVFHAIWVRGLADHADLRGLHWISTPLHTAPGQVRWKPVKAPPAALACGPHSNTSAQPRGPAAGLAHTMRQFISGCDS
ncbi:transposase [Xanthomonas sp. 3075]|uniref:transposase n=1 Tax=Xanthomonas sp. 3075 TaxID=3035315 RepID=UPI0021A7BFD8|nr:transposase [Xanthomonas sp. 3075]